MIIGVPKEIKVGENRVAVPPLGAERLVNAGHRVLIEGGAGEGSGFSDEDYRNAGAEIVGTPAKAWRAELVVKIKEPIESEYGFFHKDLLLFTYLHLAHPELSELTRKLMDGRVTAIAYETVQLSDGSLPLLEPMSEVAGKMAAQVAAHYLESTYGGRGILMGGVPGVSPCNVVVIGAGTVGWNAAQVALGMGADVTVINRGMKRLHRLAETLGSVHPGNLSTLKLTPQTIKENLEDADVVVGAVLTSGARSPILVTREMVRDMKPGSVIVDVSIDQGGIFETAHPTTLENPVYMEEGVIHYCVTNMPGAVPHTSTMALTNVTMPYVLEFADLGFIEAVKKHAALAKGVNIYDGHITNQNVAEAHELNYQPLGELL